MKIELPKFQELQKKNSQKDVGGSIKISFKNFC